MKAHRLTPAAALLVLAWASLAYAQQTAEEIYQAALYQEEVQGDLEGAIGVYERILREFPGNRPTAAKALMHIGLCHEKLGSREAQQAYERLVRDYADQTEMARLARTRLAVLREPLEQAEASKVVARRVWAGHYSRDIDFSGGPSPDGRYLTYTDWNTGDIALRDLVTEESRRLTNHGPNDYASGSAFSPDGQRVAYTWVDSGSVELRVVGLDGSPSRTLYRDPRWLYAISWSNDGKRIASAREKADGAIEVFSLSLEDGSLRPLMVLPGGFAVRLSHSLDDRFVVVGYPVNGDPRNHDISLVTTDGSGRIAQILGHPANDKLIGWLPETDDVLFSSDRSGTWDMWAIRVVEGEATEAPRLVRRAIGDGEAMGFSRDASLFYNHYTLHFTTSVAPRDPTSGQIRFEAAEPLLGSNRFPAWSPSGVHIAFVRWEKLQNVPWFEETLWVRNVLNGEERKLASHISPVIPRWSPDGRSVLVVGQEKTKNSEKDGAALYRIDVESGEASPVVEFPPDPRWWMGVGGIWTADGEGIVYVHQGRLLLRDIASSQDRELYRHPYLPSRLLTLSPDGTTLLFAIAESTEGSGAYVTGGGKIMSLSLTEGAVRELVTLEQSGTVRSIEWTPDGLDVLFMQVHEQSTDLWRVSADGGEPRKVWNRPERLGSFALHPAGDRIAYTSSENEAEIWVIANIAAALGEQR